MYGKMARVWAYQNLSFDLHLSYLESVSCPCPWRVPSECAARAGSSSWRLDGCKILCLLICQVTLLSTQHIKIFMKLYKPASFTSLTAMAPEAAPVFPSTHTWHRTCRLHQLLRQFSSVTFGVLRLTRKAISTACDHFSNVSKCFSVYQNTNSFIGIIKFLVVFIIICFLKKQILKV